MVLHKTLIVFNFLLFINFNSFSFLLHLSCIHFLSLYYLLLTSSLILDIDNHITNQDILEKDGISMKITMYNYTHHPINLISIHSLMKLFSPD